MTFFSLCLFQERNWVCVEGLNCKYELQGKTDDFPGVMQRVEEPLNVLTDIRLVDPSDQQVQFCATDETFCTTSLTLASTR